jgi:hypothetical protein
LLDAEVCPLSGRALAAYCNVSGLP